ncbi:unnamed protein product [Gemmata massiliana]|uniref:Uncharacterized protein n=2 Tax=Gemmata massiliana TaxID=1210884 RepID=A0A6P2D429_9BACT|nr:unnamed protein product [Gemmata massiliana]
MLHLHLNVNLGGAGDVRQLTALGDGTLIKLALKWGPVIASFFGVKLPDLSGLVSEVKEPVVDS